MEGLRKPILRAAGSKRLTACWKDNGAVISKQKIRPSRNQNCYVNVEDPS